MRNNLIKLSDRLDKNGQPKLASAVDEILMSFAGTQGEISMHNLLKLMPGSKKDLLNAIKFDLEAKPGSVKAVPDIDVDLYNFELDLSDVQDSPQLHKYLTNEGKNALFPDSPMAKEYDVDYIPGKGDHSDADKSLELALKELNREDFVDPSAQSEEGQKLYQKHQQQKLNLEKARQKKEVNQYVPEAIDAVDQGAFKAQKLEGRASIRNTESEIRELLVKMADDFDRSGSHDLAIEVDKTIESLAARPKTPLKRLDDDVKKNLIVFVHDADQSTSKSIKGLKELFRRLRYFDLADSAREVGLDKVVKDMEKTQDCLGGAKSKLYEMMMGRKPSVQALNDYLGTGPASEDKSSLEFFDLHTDKDGSDESEEEDEEEEESDEHEAGESEEEEREEHESDEDEDEDEEGEELSQEEYEEDLVDEMEEELRSFLAELEEEEEDKE